MKQNAVLLFRSSFGQLVQDNVEGPAEHLIHRVVGNGRMRGEDVVQKREREINKDVQEWRLNSLRGVEGVACPCRKYVVPLVSDAEIQAQEVDMLLQLERDLAAQERARGNPLYSQANEAGRENARRRGFCILRNFGAIPPYSEVELQNAFRTCRTVVIDEPWRCPEISSEQAFAMLGGYRPDRHGPWINPAWVSAEPLANE